MTKKDSPATALKEYGYVASTLSVLLLGAVAWDGVRDRPFMTAVLLCAIAASIIGMYLRWKAHLAQRKELADD